MSRRRLCLVVTGSVMPPVNLSPLFSDAGGSRAAACDGRTLLRPSGGNTSVFRRICYLKLIVWHSQTVAEDPGFVTHVSSVGQAQVERVGVETLRCGSIKLGPQVRWGVSL